MSKKKIIKIFIGFIGAVLLCLAMFIALVVYSVFGPMPDPTRELLEATVPGELPQILLTNNAKFKGHSGLYGASAFLVEGSQKQPLLVTARHLIGQSGGVDPEISVLTLDHVLESWEAYPRRQQNTTVSVSSVFLRDVDHHDLDLLVLNVKSQETIPIHILPLRTTPPVLLEIVYVVGCEYSDYDCSQKVWPGQVIYIADEEPFSRYQIQLQSPVELRGFSGAPIIDSEGKALAVLTSGGRTNDEGADLELRAESLQYLVRELSRKN